MPAAELWLTIPGVLVIVFAIPLILRRVPPNGFYGLRVPATYRDETVWYDANAASGRDLVLFGILSIVAALLPPVLGWRGEPHHFAWGVAVAVGAIVLTMVGWARANRMLRERRSNDDARGDAH